MLLESNTHDTASAVFVALSVYGYFCRLARESRVLYLLDKNIFVVLYLRIFNTKLYSFPKILASRLFLKYSLNSVYFRVDIFTYVLIKKAREYLITGKQASH